MMMVSSAYGQKQILWCPEQSTGSLFCLTQIVGAHFIQERPMRGIGRS
jgi:hypothetical protein